MSVLSAARYFTRAIDGLFSGFADLHTFRNMFERGSPLAEEQARAHHQTAANLTALDGTFESTYGVPRNIVESNGGFEYLASAMATLELRTATESVDAASLIFAHSIVDSVMLDLLIASAVANPAYGNHGL